MLEKLLKLLRTPLYWFTVVAMGLMLVLVFAQVISRYCFNYTPEWSEELARFLFVYVTFLGSALIMGESGHLAVEFLPQMLKGKPLGKVLEIIVNLCGYTFIAIMFFQGVKMTRMMTFQTSPGLQISMSIMYVILPIGALLMMLYMIKDTMKIFKSNSDGKKSSKGKAR